MVRAPAGAPSVGQRVDAVILGLSDVGVPLGGAPGVVTVGTASVTVEGLAFAQQLPPTLLPGQAASLQVLVTATGTAGLQNATARQAVTGAQPADATVVLGAVVPGAPLQGALALKPVSEADLRAEAKLRGYEGESCRECGNFTLVRNGTCLKCDTCGGTSGCS